MPGPGERQAELAKLRSARDAAAAEARASALRTQARAARLDALGRLASRDGAAEANRLEREIAALAAEAGEHRARARELDDAIRRGVTDFIGLPDGDVFAALDDNYPFLLFPVRLETKFARAAGSMQLRVRIFPDEINISTHDPLLSSGESAAGATYWAGRAAALALGPDQRAAELAAWSALASRHGGPRARYIARRTRPSVWPPADPGIVSAPAPADAAGEDEGPVRLSHSIAPPHAVLLPDYFIVIGLDQDGNEVARAVGKPIPDALLLGPDPEASEPELRRGDDGRLAADPRLDWLITFESAVDVGMAMVMDVPPAQQELGFHRLVAIGAKLTMSPDAGASALESLLAEHRYTDGVDLLRNGAATNNTDGIPSAFTSDLSADEALAAQEIAGVVPVAVLDHGNKSDAQRLAEALGIGFEAVSDWPGANEAHDIGDALAMNRALWPATIGRFLRDMVGDAATPALRQEAERFALTYVTGRTLLPNIRTGRQPYGVLATGDLARWEEAPATAERGEMATIVEAIKWFRRQFEQMGRPGQMGGGGNAALANSMRVIGQNASSVAFYSRKAVSDEAAWNTLNYTGVIPLFALNWWNERVAQRDNAFALLPIDTAKLPLAELVLFHQADALALPVVDRDPEVPLSETERLVRFDGARNYVDWLLTATTDELKGEVFKDENGVRIPAPKALLYRLLHTAWTHQLVSSSKDLFIRLHPGLLAAQVESSLVNLSGPAIVPDSEAPLFDSAKLGLSVNSRALGDYLLDASRATPSAPVPPPEALALHTQRSALERLAKLPTAALERLFAEHVDLGAYRLDAWQSGLVARRLDHMRRREGRARGLYLGAYGYVEDLIPKPAPAPVDAEDLPESLRTDAVFEQSGNGGFVHAPSLGHAVTAAVLRNGYLTHAEPETRDRMSVNLTSRRVRAAMALIEGIRAGQDIAALLGYQLERGLHENHRPLELDSYIHVLRARFPLVSGRLTPVEDGTPAEVIEARNVIDAHDLLEQVRSQRTYPHDIAGLPAPGTPESEAIAAEIERLEEALDAVADLTLAEGVHQTVQSNIDRARGVVGAVGEGEMPLIPDVVQTPRSGRTFTQRVALHLPAAGAGWLASPTPRALANPALNRWLASQLPLPGAIGFEARLAGSPAQTGTLAQIGIEPIDLVLMSGDRFGEGSSLLERLLADGWRAANDLPDALVTLYSDPVPAATMPVLVIDLATAAGVTPLGKLLPQLRALRRMLGGVRGLTAQDYRLGVDEKKADPCNPGNLVLDAGGDVAELPARIGAQRDALLAVADDLEALLDAVASDYAAARAGSAGFAPADWATPLGDLRANLRALVLYGFPEALPRSAAGTSLDAVLGLYEQGRAVLAAARKRLDEADAALGPLPPEPSSPDPAVEDRRLAARLARRVDNLVSAARHVLGGNMPLQALFNLQPAALAEIDARLAEPIEDDPLALEAWLQSLVRVRPRMADIGLAGTAAEWTIGAELSLKPVQLPLRAGDPWIGQAWSNPPADGEILSVMTLDAPVSLGGTLEGLVVDEWTETVPGLNETTGVAFHFDRPSAAAPQALLLAAPSHPDGKWQAGELLGTVIDTFARARLRALDPEQVAASSLFPVLPTALSSFARGSPFASSFLARDVVQLSAATE